MGDKKAVTVLITLMNGDSFFAKIFLDEFQRAQDALNDNRKFIPVDKHMKSRTTHQGDIYALTMVHKDAIMTMEER